MKKITIIPILLFLTLGITSCNENYMNDYYDNIPPNPPTGVEVLNGDNRVDLYWNNNRERDVAGYNVYFSTAYNGKYKLIGTTLNNFYIDDGAANGVLNYYAVTAYDYNNNESELSPDVAYATPRPEGFNQSIFDYHEFPNNSGYSFTTYSAVAFDNLDYTDFFFDIDNGTPYLDVHKDTDIQDMGVTSDIYDIAFAPESGWSLSKDAVAIAGHTYVIWTWDNHFAKIRVKTITRDRIVFDWAFQLVEGNPQLKVSGEKHKREKLERIERKRQ
ncbi:MAG: hypothetical protein GW805_02395 [Ignavibacteria bacterium]|nr:hypothetical protein [Ignavibacteria bacterium]NCS81319.1 hypothetical protein [Ignavibacteria bacterium]OIO19986.1 MAG: hypothetical protein AUJ54_06030 [Ignavibacteria bacterium CG1_02_37_35]PIX94011.1 MAG: hypothetical protein COZ25_07695 [Ignavibacteria bacterium CG_4_10_14_3_um_filter_37_18]PJC58058.1 MAG: hypothetical protein CO025_10270 [Ignavibacteria bacterium CG_4_9_14_0_2_um_filter_37_13]